MGSLEMSGSKVGIPIAEVVNPKVPNLPVYNWQKITEPFLEACKGECVSFQQMSKLSPVSKALTKFWVLGSFAFS